jgi:hypothetical protein
MFKNISGNFFCFIVSGLLLLLLLDALPVLLFIGLILDKMLLLRLFKLFINGLKFGLLLALFKVLDVKLLLFY